jgi:hypothetical protein
LQTSSKQKYGFFQSACRPQYIDPSISISATLASDEKRLNCTSAAAIAYEGEGGAAGAACCVL